MKKYESLIRNLEEYAKEHPTMYKYKVLLISLAGYIYIISLLASILGLLSALGYVMIEYRKGSVYLVKIAIPLIAFSFVLIKALWVRLNRPQGYEINIDEYPHLFEYINNLQKKLKAPRISHVLLTDEKNAAVYQYPRLGLLGWYDNYLIMGLPLMQALTPEEFNAVLAHEYGHIAGSHSKITGLIYRIRMSWENIVDHMEKKAQSNFLIDNFVSRYFPYLNAYSFVLMRNHEYQADRVAAECSGPDIHANALIRSRIAGDHWNSSFWPDIYKEANEKSEPEILPYLESEKFFKQIDPQKNEKLFQDLMQEQTGIDDSHPSLKDRLSFLGEEPGLPGPLKQSAAEYYLGDKLQSIERNISLDWQENIGQVWMARYAEVQEYRNHIKELEELHKKGELDVDELTGYARMLEEYTEGDKYRQVLLEAYEKDSQNSAVNFHLGRIQLKDGEESGIQLIEKAMQGDDEYITYGCSRIYDFLISQNRASEAKSYEERYNSQVELERIRSDERESIYLSDKFNPHELSESVIRNLYSQLDRVAKLKSVYLVQKKLKYSQVPLYVLGVRHKGGEMKTDENGQNPLLAYLTEKLEFSGELFIVILNSNGKEMEKNMKNIPGSLIYS